MKIQTKTEKVLKMVKETKTAKLTEDVLQEQPLDQTQTPAPTQATPEEVNQASADLTDPTLTDPNDVGVEDASLEDLANEVPAVENTPTTEDPMFTPPAPGYVPAGWVKIEDLASAVAQATGDVTAAETAPDAQTPAATPEMETAPVTPSEAVTEPLVQQPQQPVQTQQPVQESTKNLRERLNEDVDLTNAGNTEEVPTQDANTASVVNDTKLEESKKLNEEMVMNDEEEGEEPLDEPASEPEEETTEVSEPEESIEDTVEDENTSDEKMSREDEGEEYELPEEVPLDEEEEDFLTRITSFLDDIKDDAEDKMEDAEDEVEEAADSFESTSEFLRSLLSNDDDFEGPEDEEDPEDDLEMESSDDYDDSEEDEEDIDDEEEDDMGEDAYDESYRHSNPHVRESVKYNSFLPAGSEHFAAEDNIVKSYEESSAAKRRAIANFRASLKENRSRDSQLRRESSISRNRFGEALRGENLRESYRERETLKESSNSNSWGNKNILNKYEESETLSWKELLNKGFLG